MEDTADRVHDILATFAQHLAPIEDVDGDMAEMANPVLSEWVLVSSIVDMDSDEVRIGIIAAPTMLRSHVIGLLTMAVDEA